MFQYQERKASRIQPAGGPRPPPVDPCQPIFTHVSLQSSSTPGCQDGPAAAASNGAELSRGRLTGGVDQVLPTCEKQFELRLQALTDRTHVDLSGEQA